MENFMDSLIRISLETLLISGGIGFFITKRDERLKKKIESEFKKRDKFFDAKISFRLRALEELLAPIVLQFTRSKIALKSYNANNEFREKILKKCNETILDLLLTKGYLIPTSLMPSAVELINHYDEWLQAYQIVRESENKSDTPYVFTYNFPSEAERKFIGKYNAMLLELKIEESLADN